MATETKNGEAIVGGIGLVFLSTLAYSCFFEGESPTPVPSTTVEAATSASVPISAEQEKQAEDAAKATINLNGFLCADIIDVKPAGGVNLFAVQCIEYRDGSGSAIYLFDRDSRKVSRL